MKPLRIIALLSVYNERRFIKQVLEHLTQQGVETYVIDNESTDETRALAESFRGRGLVGLETLPRRGAFELERLLRREEELHEELGADWYLHQDADQFRYAPQPYRTLAEGIAAVDRAGYNAIDFDVFDFMPTSKDENYDDGRYLEEMKYYYYFRRGPLDQVKGWKNFGQPLDLASSGGHRVAFKGRKVFPQAFIQRHYYVLSWEHAVEKYCNQTYSQEEVGKGWHGVRATVRPEDLRFPDRALLKRVSDDNTWDKSDPWVQRYLFVAAPAPALPEKPLPPPRNPVLETIDHNMRRVLRRLPYASELAQWIRGRHAA